MVLQDASKGRPPTLVAMASTDDGIDETLARQRRLLSVGERRTKYEEFERRLEGRCRATN